MNIAIERLHWRTIDLTGKTFGRWTVLGYSGQGKSRGTMWLCRCECGTEKTVDSASLRRGGSLSCGCFNEEVCTKHGQCGSRLYGIWAGMIGRCTRTRHKSYRNYGGRGIKVCERWMSFANFAADMPPFPGDGYQIDRIDNDGNYEPGNCRWATRKENMRNRRTTHLMTLNGVTKPMSDWADELGINRDTIRDRLRRGWSEERALTVPVETKFRGVA